MGQEHSIPTANMNRSISVGSAGRMLLIVGLPVKVAIPLQLPALVDCGLRRRRFRLIEALDTGQRRSWQPVWRVETRTVLKSATMPRGPKNPMPRLLALLRGAYGRRLLHCWGDGVSVLVDTILSQNTSAANSNSGYRQLRRRFRSWNQVADAPVGEVERCIRVSGLSNLK